MSKEFHNHPGVIIETTCPVNGPGSTVFTAEDFSRKIAKTLYGLPVTVAEFIVHNGPASIAETLPAARPLIEGDKIFTVGNMTSQENRSLVEAYVGRALTDEEYPKELGNLQAITASITEGTIYSGRVGPTFYNITD